MSTPVTADSGMAWRRLFSPYLAILAVALVVPWLGNDYWTAVASRVAVYWVLIAGLNLAVGFAGQLAIGWIALLTLGAYTASALVAGNLGPAWHPVAALAAAGAVGETCGTQNLGCGAGGLSGFFTENPASPYFATDINRLADCGHVLLQHVTSAGDGLVPLVWPDCSHINPLP